MNKDARLAKVDKLRANGASIKQMAESLGVTERTIKRDMAELRSEGKLLKREIPKVPAMRDAVLDRHLDTIDEAQWAVLKLRSFIEKVEEEINKKVELGELDGVLLSSYAKTFDSYTNQLTLIAKMLGLITDAPQLSVAVIDNDVADTVAFLRQHSNCKHCGEDTGIAQALYNHLIANSERRARRMPELAMLGEPVVEAEFREVKGGE